MEFEGVFKVCFEVAAIGVFIALIYFLIASVQIMKKETRGK